MRRLILMRHAKTERDAPSGKDQDRRLDARGHADCAEMATWLARSGYTADLVLVSTATRAQETWQQVNAAIPSLQAEHLPELYGAGPSDLLHAVHAETTPMTKTVLVIGHNPGLHELALALTASGDAAGLQALASNLPTSGIAVIDFAIDDWNDVGFRSGRLICFASPKLLRDKSGGGD
jgi:phosphohistidine phosphatase